MLAFSLVCGIFLSYMWNLFILILFIHLGCARSSLLPGLFSICSEWGLLSSCSAGFSL